MDITEIFKIPLFKDLTLKMQEELLDNLEYTIDYYSKGETIIRQGSPCNALHVLIEGKLNVDVLDVSGVEVRVETIQAPRTFATPHLFTKQCVFPATFTVEEDVTLIRIPKDHFFKVMSSMPQLLRSFLCISTSCNKCIMTRLRVLSFRGIRSRYIYYLLDHLEKGADVAVTEHNQVQLAEYFGVTRPALSKEIRKLVDGGFILLLPKNKVHILNRQGLASML